MGFGLDVNGGKMLLEGLGLWNQRLRCHEEDINRSW